MAAVIERPVYHEGQILGANDLQQGLDYSRDEQARHERYLHSWGIAHGLDVKKEGERFLLQTGFAIDSSGAPIVVAEPEVLDETQLRQEALLSGDDKGFFPIFVARAEEEQTGGQLIGQCSTGAATRQAEKYAIRFRRIATGWDEQDSPSVADGPNDADESKRVVLIGFVKWDNTKRKIVEFQRRHNDIHPRYAGVRADGVEGRGGILTLRSRKPKESDAPMVVVDHHSKEKTFVLGLDDGQGNINEVFTVDVKGNVKAKGDISADGALNGTIRAGEVSVESGIAHDGMKLPMPKGIAEGDVKSGVTLHISVAPRVDLGTPPSTPPTTVYFPLIKECFVDENRVVHCAIVWFDPGNPVSEAEAGIVDYLIMATVPDSAGDQ